MTPPMWLRHLLPWRVIDFIRRNPRVCGARIAMWKMGYEDWPWGISRSCWDGPNGGWDYCGKWETEAAFRKALSEASS